MRIWSLPAIRSHFWCGILVNLTIPKLVVFVAAVLIVIFRPYLGLAGKAFIVVNHLALEWVAYFCLRWLVSRPAMTRGYLKTKSCLTDVLRVSWRPRGCACF